MYGMYKNWHEAYEQAEMELINRFPNQTRNWYEEVAREVANEVGVEGDLVQNLVNPVLRR